MKSSIHLFYGIIIGILATLCIGQSIKQEDKKEFKEVKISQVYLFDPPPPTEDGSGFSANYVIDFHKKGGWTIIDWEVENGLHYFHLGK